MPKNTKFSILGYDCTKPTPTVEEWTQKWGADSLLTEATNNVWYRGCAAEARDLFLHGQEEVKVKDAAGKETVVNKTGPYKDAEGNVTLQARKGLDDLTGIQRKTKKVVNTKAKTETEVWDESEATFYKRVIAELVATKKFPTADAAVASFATGLQECVNLVEFDAFRAPPGERKAKTLPQRFLDAAKTAIDKGNAGKLAKLLTKMVGHPVGETMEDLAKAMKEDDENQRAKRAQELEALVKG